MPSITLSNTSVLPPAWNNHHTLQAETSLMSKSVTVPDKQEGRCRCDSSALHQYTTPQAAAHLRVIETHTVSLAEKHCSIITNNITCSEHSLQDNTNGKRQS